MGVKIRVSFYIHTDAYTDVNVGMGIGILYERVLLYQWSRRATRLWI